MLVHVDTEQAHEQLINSRLAYVSVSRGRPVGQGPCPARSIVVTIAANDAARNLFAGAPRHPRPPRPAARFFTRHRHVQLCALHAELRPDFGLDSGPLLRRKRKEPFVIPASVLKQFSSPYRALTEPGLVPPLRYDSMAEVAKRGQIFQCIVAALRSWHAMVGVQLAIRVARAVAAYLALPLIPVLRLTR